MKRSMLFVGSLMLAACLSGCPASAPKATPSPTAHSEEEHGHDHEHEGHDHEKEEKHEHPGHVELSPTQQKAAGVEVQAVQQRAFAGEFRASGLLTYDKDLQVRVTSRLPGKASELKARLGEWVQPGQALAVLDCPELVRYKAEYHESETNLRLAQQALERRRNLALYGDEVRRPMDEAKNEVAAARAELDVALSKQRVAQKARKRVEELREDGITSGAQADQARADVEQASAEVRKAEQELRIARDHLAREQQVQKLGVRASKETQEAQADVERAAERTQHLREGLEALQADPESHGSLVVVRAPIAGIVTNRPVTLGESITAEDELFTLVNVHRLWLWVSVPERELSRLSTGQKVEVEVTAFPQQNFQGKISYVAPELDEKTRSARALVIIDNQSLRLKPAMTAKVRVGTGGKQSLVIPASALETVESRQVVYRFSAPDVFERTPVVLGQRAGDQVEVLEGLSAGDKVVTKGSYVLKAEDQKASLEEGGHHH